MLFRKGKRKLNDEDVKKISHDTRNYAVIAEEHKVDHSVIKLIKNGKG